MEETESKKAKKPTAAPILALSAKPLPPSQAAERLERRAARVLKAERMERLDRARVRDVVEGWVPAPGAEMGSQEFERALRKTAQRGGEYERGRRPATTTCASLTSALRCLSPLAEARGPSLSANSQSSSSSMLSSSLPRTPRLLPKRWPTRRVSSPRRRRARRRRTTSSVAEARTMCSRRSRSSTLCAEEAPSRAFDPSMSPPVSHA